MDSHNILVKERTPTERILPFCSRFVSEHVLRMVMF